MTLYKSNKHSSLNFVTVFLLLCFNNSLASNASNQSENKTVANHSNAAAPDNTNVVWSQLMTSLYGMAGFTCVVVAVIYYQEYCLKKDSQGQPPKNYQTNYGTVPAQC